MKRIAASVDGRWHGIVQGPDGDLKLVYSFKNDGGKITGKVESPMGESPFLSGAMKGDEVTWETEFQGMKIRHSGKLSGDKMTVSVVSPEWELTLQLTREIKTTPASSPTTEPSPSTTPAK